MDKTTTPGASSIGTKICYAAGDIGCNFAWTFISGFLLLYYTDSVGMSAAVIGTMMLIARIMDGASDILMGIVIEKTNTRWGKARPWLLFFCVPFAVNLFLLFHVPTGINETGKLVYIYVTYIFLTVICYTAINLSYNAMLPRFSLTPHDRNIVSAFRGIAVMIAALLISVVTPILLVYFGGYQNQISWDTISAIYACIALIMLAITFIGVKEKIAVNLSGDGKQAKISIKNALSILLRNKYFYLAIFLFVAFYSITGMGGVMIYFARDVLGDINLFGFLSGINLVPMLICIPFLPMMYDKFGKRNVMMTGAWISAAGCALQLINPANVTLYVIFTVVRGFGFIMFSMPIFTLASDIVEFIDSRHGMRTEGLVTSANSFGLKVGTGLGSAMVGWILAFGKYDPEAVVQPPSAHNAMIVLQIVIPMILSTILAVLMIFWDIEKYQKKT